VSGKRIAGFSINWVMKVGIAAVIFILFFKWAANKIPVPGLQRAANAV
jgi:hypothetical protein